MAMHPAYPNTLYVTGVSGFGNHKTVDGGANWALLPPGGDGGLGGGFDLVIDPAHPTTVYAGGPVGVRKTIDGGATWFDSDTGITDFFVQQIVIDPSAPTSLYAGTSNGDPTSGVFKSTDAGLSWVAANNGLGSTPVWTLGMDPTETATLYAGTSAGVFKTTDGGANWGLANSGLTGTVTSFAFAAPAFFIQLQTVAVMVEALGSPAGPLSPQQVGGLVGKLDQAQSHLNDDQPESACSSLQTFIDRVNRYVTRGILTPAEADPLISLTEAVRGLIPCPA